MKKNNLPLEKIGFFTNLFFSIYDRIKSTPEGRARRAAKREREAREDAVRAHKEKRDKVIGSYMREIRTGRISTRSAQEGVDFWDRINPAPTYRYGSDTKTQQLTFNAVSEARKPAKTTGKEPSTGCRNAVLPFNSGNLAHDGFGVIRADEHKPFTHWFEPFSADEQE